MKLKPEDKKLLNLIQAGDMCVPKISKIARKLGLPTSTVQAKLERFKREGVIKEYSAVLDPEKVGRGYFAFKFGGKKFHKTTDLEEYGKKLAKIPEVQEVYFLVGDYDYLVKMCLKDEKEYTRVAPQIAIMMDGCKGIIAPKCFKNTQKIIVD